MVPTKVEASSGIFAAKVERARGMYARPPPAAERTRRAAASDSPVAFIVLRMTILLREAFYAGANRRPLLTRISPSASNRLRACAGGGGSVVFPPWALPTGRPPELSSLWRLPHRRGRRRRDGPGASARRRASSA